LAVVATDALAGDSVARGQPGRPLAERIRYRLLDVYGAPVAGAKVTWRVAGVGAVVDSASSVTDPNGDFLARWVLGTDASESQQLTVRVETRSAAISVSRRAVAVPWEITRLAFEVDTAELRVGTVHPAGVAAVDPFNNRFMPRGLRLSSLDTTLVSVQAGDSIRVAGRGLVAVVAEVEAFAETAWVHGVQHVSQVISDSILAFHSLGQAITLTTRLVDDLGQVVEDSFPTVSVADTAILTASLQPPYVLQSHANGTTDVILRVGDVDHRLVAHVQQEAVEVALAASPHFDALGDTARLQYAVRDSGGSLVPTVALAFATSRPDVAVIDDQGVITAVGNGTATIVAATGNGAADSTAVTVVQRVARVVASADSLHFDAFGAAAPLTAHGLDRLGSAVAGPVASLNMLDTAIAAVAAGQVQARANGVTAVRVLVDTASAVVPVVVAQRPHHVVGPDTVRFEALGDSLPLGARAADSLGSPVSGAIMSLVVSDPAVVRVVGDTALEAVRNGVAEATFAIAGLPGRVAVVVEQVAVALEATAASMAPIQTVSLDSLLPLTCVLRDRRGAPLGAQPVVLPSAAGRWTATTCADVRVQASGIDSIRVVHGGLTAVVPVVLAVRPIVNEALGAWLQVDSLPTGVLPWSPSVRRNSRGEIEVYFAGYPVDPKELADHRADLHRLVSTDGLTYRYDGVVLQKDADNCAPEGSGIENVAVVPRAGAPGWRMFYAAGSFACYGWQVFSAVSDDERTWTREGVVRVDNGGQLPPAAPNWPPWPAGEGMVIDQLPSGEWRMLVGSYERVLPFENKFQITEWRSPDQLGWTYRGPVLTTRDMPQAGQGTVYSPTITEIAPGVHRMIFAGDNRPEPGWRGQLFSAVSIDRQTWQLEGVLLGSEETKLWYCALVDDHLIFIREDNGSVRRLATATIRMP
jgi:hypothetical protein